MLLASADNAAAQKPNAKKGSTSSSGDKSRGHFSISGLDDLDGAVPPIIAPPRDKGGGSGRSKEKGISVGKQTKIRKALMKFSFLPSKTSNR